jgi:hypothetical protein
MAQPHPVQPVVPVPKIGAGGGMLQTASIPAADCPAKGSLIMTVSFSVEAAKIDHLDHSPRPPQIAAPLHSNPSPCGSSFSPPKASQQWQSPFSALLSQAPAAPSVSPQSNRGQPGSPQAHLPEMCNRAVQKHVEIPNSCLSSSGQLQPIPIPMPVFAGPLPSASESTPRLNLDSRILPNGQEAKQSKKWLGKFMRGCIKTGAQLKLVYRGSRDGYSSAAFHSRVTLTPAGPTLTLVRCHNDKVFGMYSAVTWPRRPVSGVTMVYDPSGTSCLFSLVNKQGKPLKMPLRPGRAALTVGYLGGACFGGWENTHDIPDVWLMQYGDASDSLQGNSANGVEETSSFQLDEASTQAGAFYDATTLAGQRRFGVREIEVFSIHNGEDDPSMRPLSNNQADILHRDDLPSSCSVIKRSKAASVHAVSAAVTHQGRAFPPTLPVKFPVKPQSGAAASLSLQGLFSKALTVC